LAHSVGRRKTTTVVWLVVVVAEEEEQQFVVVVYGQVQITKKNPFLKSKATIRWNNKPRYSERVECGLCLITCEEIGKKNVLKLMI
jgi:hypothetical protein